MLDEYSASDNSKKTSISQAIVDVFQEEGYRFKNMANAQAFVAGKFSYIQKTATNRKRRQSSLAPDDTPAAKRKDPPSKGPSIG